jgi:uncharacterized membrane protein
MGWPRPKKRMNLVLEKRLMDTFKETFTAVVERVGLVIDGAGVIVIVVGLIVALLKYLLAGGRSADPFRQLRQDLGRGILLGLEFLVAADIIRTVAVTPTLQSVGVLGLIVVIRTFLSMALQVEVEGRLPWQRPPVG